MKTKLFIASISAIALTLAGCSNDENEIDNGPVAAHITAKVSNTQTRAVDDKWTKDHIGITVIDAPNSDMETMYTNVQYQTSQNGGTSATFIPTIQNGGIFFQDPDEEVTFSAYAPYQLSPATDGTIAVNTKDNDIQAEANQPDIDFIFASGATASKNSPTVAFTDNSSKDCSFYHKMTRLLLVLKTFEPHGFKANDIFLDANVVKLGGLIHEGTFSTTNGMAAIRQSASVVDDWNITKAKKMDGKQSSIPVTNENTRTYSLILLPQDVTKAPLSPSITIDGKTYSNSTTIARKFEAGKSYTYLITVKQDELEVGNCTISSWLEVSMQGGSAIL